MHIQIKNWDFIISRITVKLYIKKIWEHMGGSPMPIPKNKIAYKDLRSLIDIQDVDTSSICENEAKHLVKMYLEHRFDLLGSGWKCVNIIKRPQTSAYNEIDWHRDFISGYVWKIPLNRAEIPQGADIKTVWELSRMQHLLQLSTFAIKYKELRKQAIHEYKNIVEDFIAHNVFPLGINWTSAMDVAIRSVNMLLAYDIFCQLDEFGILGEAFKNKLVKSLQEHEAFILRNLECDLLHGRNNNHYLSNLLGLLVIEAYLDIDQKVWAFAVEEISREMKKQYYKDGSNFEGSTSYHRLSTEILVLAAAFIGRMEGNIPKDMLDTLNKASHFTHSVTKLNGRIAQIGDNDSGHIIKLSPAGVFLSGKDAAEKYVNLKDLQDEEYFDEDILDHGALLAEIGGLIDNRIIAKEKIKYPLESSFVKAISKSEEMHYEGITDSEREIGYQNNKILEEFEHQVSTEISLVNINAGLDTSSWKSYPDFGLYYYKTDLFDLFFKLKGCAKKVTGHIHDDILHIELNVKGEDILVDPGTYTYSADKTQRNNFRSCRAHIVPFHKEPGCIFKNLFQVVELIECELLQLSKNTISVLISNGQLLHYRSIRIEPDKIIIVDKSNQPFVPNFKNYQFFSNGYGKMMKADESKSVSITSKKIK